MSLASAARELATARRRERPRFWDKRDILGKTMDSRKTVRLLIGNEDERHVMAVRFSSFPIRGAKQASGPDGVAFSTRLFDVHKWFRIRAFESSLSTGRAVDPPVELAKRVPPFSPVVLGTAPRESVTADNSFGARRFGLQRPEEVYSVEKDI